MKKITIKEFLHKYHNYCVQNVNQANRECERVNRELEVSENGWAEVIHFPNIGYCLMLKSAVDYIRNLK